MVQSSARIVYTRTDEAPLLATYSLLPIISAYAAKAGVDIDQAAAALQAADGSVKLALLMLAADATPQDAAAALHEADGILRDAIAALA